jgi:hypothetical protein
MPSEPHQNHLLIIEDDKGRREFILSSPVYSIGRDPQCDIRLVSQFVSRRHATLVQLANEDGSYHYRIVDGNLRGKPSANGLLINGRKLKAHDLQNDDEIIFGPQVHATYYSLRREAIVTMAPDEFDITLISPGMVGDAEDEDAGADLPQQAASNSQDDLEEDSESGSDDILKAEDVLEAVKDKLSAIEEFDSPEDDASVRHPFPS